MTKVTHGYVGFRVGSAGLTVLLFAAVPDASAQRAITTVTPVSEPFTIGTTATASLPSDFRADKQTTARTVGTFAGAAAATERSGGTGGITNNGIYNFGAGDADTATDRAVGFLSSGTATKSGNVYGFFQADPGINTFNVSYGVEKYRNGSNPAGFTLQLYYSKNGSTFTSAGSAFQTAFAADADSEPFATPPGETRQVTGTIDLSAVIDAASAVLADRQFYLAWNYSVSSGTTTTNAQALAIDNVSISAAPEPGTTLLAAVSGTSLLGLRRRIRTPVPPVPTFRIA